MVLGLTNKIGIANSFVRAELGLEAMEARWQKLRLGYWRRIQVADQGRALSVVSALQRDRALRGEAQGSWMQGTRQLLHQVNLAEYWYEPELAKRKTKEEWKELVYNRTEQDHEDKRRLRWERWSVCRGI